MNVGIERAYPTPFANSPLLPMLILSLAKQKHCPKSTPTHQEEYDYIVVGAGVSGSVVASRLSEERCVTVLLLEAGKSPPVLTEIPSISRHFVNSDIDYRYKTVPQKHTAKLHINQEIPISGGKVVGGSAILSSMLYSRGNQENYDDWAAQGAEGWSFKDVWPYFLKFENNTDPEYRDNGYHSSSGPMSIHKPRYESIIKDPLLEAINESGYKMIDPNSGGKTGFYDFQAFLRDSQKCTTAKAYLVPAEDRPNLHIVTHAHVNKVVLEGTKATGVEFERDNSTHTVRARREVILAAGAVKTPQLLMLSGIGPREHLQELEIPVVVDLPVGDNFHDHGQVPLTYELQSNVSTTDELVADHTNIREYIDNRTGPLSSVLHLTMVGFINGENTTESVPPTGQICMLEATHNIVKYQTGVQQEVYERAFKPHEGKPLFMCAAYGMKPRSRGTVRLSSNDPHDHPRIDPNYYEDPRDVEDTVTALEACDRFATSEPMKKVGAKLLSSIPGCEEKRNDTRSFFECMVRSLVFSIGHLAGTCKMGNPSDPTTVVDPQLRVKGIDSLRVVDASVMPFVPSGYISTPTIMIAEKASDIIKQTVRCEKEEDENSIHSALSGHEEE